MKRQISKFWKGKESQLAIMSAMLGATNMGFKMPEAKVIARLIKKGETDSAAAMTALTSEYMERYEDEECFAAEAEFIGKDLSKEGEKTKKYWGDTWKRYEEAEQLAKVL